MENDNILKCDLSNRPLAGILFDWIQPIALGVVLLIMIVLQIRAGIPEDPVARLLLVLSFIATGMALAVFLRELMLYEATYVQSIELDPFGTIRIEGVDGVHSMTWEDVLFTVTYTSFFTMSVIFFSKNDYCVARMSNINIFLKETKQAFTDFYAIAAFVKENSPRNENVVISSRAKRHPWIRFTRFVPERDSYSPRAQGVMDRVRDGWVEQHCM